MSYTQALPWAKKKVFLLFETGLNTVSQADLEFSR